jgi:hypothetical protein
MLSLSKESGGCPSLRAINLSLAPQRSQKDSIL